MSKKVKLIFQAIILIIFITSLFILISRPSLAEKTTTQQCNEAENGKCCCVSYICQVWEKFSACKNGTLFASPCSGLTQTECKDKEIFEIGETPIIFIPQVKIPNFLEPGKEYTKIGSETIASFVSAFYKWAVVAIAILAVIMIIISGVTWIFAAGNPTTIKSAQERFFSAIIGLVLLLITIPLLNLINPALVNLSLPNIPNITGKSMFSALDDQTMNTMFTPPESFWDPGEETMVSDTIANKRCGSEYEYKGINYIGTICGPDRRGGNKPKRVCYMPAEVDFDEYEYWQKNKDEPFNDFMTLGDANYGEPRCNNFPTFADFMYIPENATVMGKSGYNDKLLCGKVNKGVLPHYYSTGIKCPGPDQTCVLLLLYVNNRSDEEKDERIMSGFCSPALNIKKYCRTGEMAPSGGEPAIADEIRIDCKNCPSNSSCSNASESNLTENDKICCQGYEMNHYIYTLR